MGHIPCAFLTRLILCIWVIVQQNDTIIGIALFGMEIWRSNLWRAGIVQHKYITTNVHISVYSYIKTPADFGLYFNALLVLSVLCAFSCFQHIFWRRKKWCRRALHTPLPIHLDSADISPWRKFERISTSVLLLYCHNDGLLLILAGIYHSFLLEYSFLKLYTATRTVHSAGRTFMEGML